MITQLPGAPSVYIEGPGSRDTSVEEIRKLVRNLSDKGRKNALPMAARIRDFAGPEDPQEVRDELNALAAAVGNCGGCNRRIYADMTERIDTFHCSRALLCWHCARQRSWKNAFLDAGMVMSAHEAGPTLRFMMLTLTVPTTADLEAQLTLIWRTLRLLPKRRVGAWSDLRGLIWQVEIQIGQDRRWRSHVHAIAATRESSQDFSFELLLQWAIETHGAPHGKKLETALRNQHSQPFWTHVSGPLTTGSDTLSLGYDAFGISLYAGKPVDLSIDDRIHAFATVNGRRLRQPTGVFWGRFKGDKADVQRVLGKTPLSIRVETETQLLDGGLDLPFMRYLAEAGRTLAYRRRIREHCFSPREVAVASPKSLRLTHSGGRAKTAAGRWWSSRRT